MGYRIGFITPDQALAHFSFEWFYVTKRPKEWYFCIIRHKDVPVIMQPVTLLAGDIDDAESTLRNTYGDYQAVSIRYIGTKEDFLGMCEERDVDLAGR